MDREEQPARLALPQGQRTRLPRGTRLKEDAGEGAMGSASPRNVDDMSRESSPQRSPPDNTRRRDRYALLFGIQLTDVDRAGSHMLPHYAWNETIIKDILGAEVQEISDVIVIESSRVHGVLRTAFKRTRLHPGRSDRDS